MKKICVISMAMSLCIASTAYGESVGNPRPGSPHDTLNIRLMKAASGEVGCSGGGHAAFIRYDDDTGLVFPTNIYISMVDWAQADNDGDGFFDEDPLNAADDDLDGLIDEDGVEPGASTGFIDCDGLDGEVTLQIRDTEPETGVVSTHEWFIRASGRPGENFAFWTNADQVGCVLVDDPDGIPLTGDEVVDCSYGDTVDWVQLGYVNLTTYDGGCVKQVTLGGKNSAKGGGKTPFCDITGEFEVDVDVNGDGIIDATAGEQDQYLFSISCVDVPETIEDESATCPLGRMIWEVDEENTTTKAKVQLFVGHADSANIKGGKITGKGSK